MQKVTNKNRQKSEADHYKFVVAKFHETGKRVNLLFTEIELSDMEKVRIPIKFRNNVLYKATIAYKPTYLWYSKHLGHIFRISPGQLETAIKRAENNPEDCLKKNWIQRILGL